VNVTVTGIVPPVVGVAPDGLTELTLEPRRKETVALPGVLLRSVKLEPTVRDASEGL